ncbi:uncharacterized protein LOC121999703 [Zingiber officinale]|uniref:uncharacterized protein LOC121999703 n=1 Tax=Zingiber officinale TaxID=94328 RepID=UPI001C4A7C66|nr:uncharacterized protein LOC121999703 [Zingiber officinale]
MEERRNTSGLTNRPRADQGRPNMQQQGCAREQGEAREEENKGNAAIRDIGMIYGGPTNGDSGRARMSVGWRSMLFGPQDLEGLELPHDDALIIKVVITNSRVGRVFVDTGSSVNVLFRSAFEEMQIDVSELQPVTTSLYGFTGNEVKPMGQIKLAISLGVSC